MWRFEQIQVLFSSVYESSNPPADLFDPNPSVSQPIFTTEISSLDSTFFDQSSSKFRAILTRYASSWLSLSSSTSLNLSAVSVKEYDLMNQREYFEDVCAFASTRQWFEEAIEYGNGPVYLITGFRTFVDMNIDQRNTQGWGTGGNITAPLEAIAGVPATFGLDVGVEGSRENEGGVKRSYKSKGEMVFAIQVRKVKFEWFSSRAEGAKLDRKTTCKVLWAVREGVGAEGEDDVVEAMIGGEQDDKEEEEDEVALGDKFEVQAHDGATEIVIFAAGADSQDR